MATKALKRKATDLLPYPAEDLEPRNLPEEIASEDAFVERNREALNDALAEGYRDIDTGQTQSLDEVEAEIERRRKSRGKP